MSLLYERKKIDSKKLSIFLLHLIRSFLSTITFNNNEINVVKYQWSNHIYANLDIHIEIENNLFKLKNKSFFLRSIFNAVVVFLWNIFQLTHQRIIFSNHNTTVLTFIFIFLNDYCHSAYSCSQFPFFRSDSAFLQFNATNIRSFRSL